jgi:hypothetical protein
MQVAPTNPTPLEIKFTSAFLTLIPFVAVFPPVFQCSTDSAANSTKVVTHRRSDLKALTDFLSADRCQNSRQSLVGRFKIFSTIYGENVVCFSDIFH